MTENQSTHLQSTHALYRFYDDLGQLLYVGITHDPAKRIGQHAATKTWWTAVRGISLEWYPSRIEALAAERRAIKVERPLTNIQRPAPYAPSLPEPCYDCGSSACPYYIGYEAGMADAESLARIARRRGSDAL